MYTHTHTPWEINHAHLLAAQLYAKFMLIISTSYQGGAHADSQHNHLNRALGQVMDK